MSDSTTSPTPPVQALGDQLFPESETGQTRLEAAKEGVEEGQRLAEIARGNEEAREEMIEEEQAVELTGGKEELGDEDDLFGEDSDAEAKPEAGSKSRTASPTLRSRRLSSSSHSDNGRNPLEYDEEDVEPELVTEAVNEQTLLLPKRPKLESSDDKAWQLRLPSYIALDDEPFHPDIFRGMLDSEDKPQPTTAKEARAEALATMLKVRNTLRWRWVTGPDGRPKRESNARMVKWEDGSMSLQLGNEIYDVTPSGGASFATSNTPAMFTQEKVMQVERPIAGHLTLRPSTTSNRTHQERAKAIGQQATKHARLKYHVEAHPNPEKEEKERAEQRAKTERLRKRRIAADRPRATRVPGAGGASRGYKRRVRRDDSEEDEAVDSDDDGFARPSRGGKRARSEEVGEYEEDDGFVVADDDDEEPEQEEDEASDDAAYGSSKRKSSSSKKAKKQPRVTKDYDSDPDSMEEAERRIEEMEKEKKRAKKAAAAARGSSPVPKAKATPSKGKTKSKEYIDDSDDEDAEGEAVDDDEEEDDAMEIESEDEA